MPVKDDDKEATEYKPRSKGEEKFAKDHKLVKSDAEQKDKITYLMATEKKLKKKSKKKKKFN